MVSLMLCTMDRYEQTVHCVGPTLANAGYAYELLSVDNGSKDERVPEYISQLNPVYHCLNKENEGYGRMLNQMMLRASGDYLCAIDSDLELPEGWLADLVRLNKAIPESGVSCVQTVDGDKTFPTVHMYGVTIRRTLHPIGVKFFNRGLMEKIGYFDEEFHPYGHEDIAYTLRADKAGFVNYYSMMQGSSPAWGNTPEYIALKIEAVERGAGLLQQRAARVYTGDYYTPPPALK